MIKYVINFILSYLATFYSRARIAHKVTYSFRLLRDVPVEGEHDVPVESRAVPCVQQLCTVYFLFFYTFSFCKLPTTVVASSFSGVDSQTHLVDVTYLLRVVLTLVSNSCVQFIFLFV